MILDPTSEGEKVLEYLEELINKLENLQEKAFQYKTHQKNFKVNYTYYSMTMGRYSVICVTLGQAGQAFA